MAKIKFGNGVTVNFDGDPTPEDIEEVAAGLGISEEPKTLAGKTLSTMKEFSPFPTSLSEVGQDFATRPMNPVLGLEKYGSQVKGQALAPIERGMDNLVVGATTGLLKADMRNMAPLPLLLNEVAAKPALRALTPFTPSEFMNLGAMSMDPEAVRGGQPNDSVTPNPLTEKPIAPNLGKGYAENIIPSTAKEIKHSQKYMAKDAADLVMERPELGNSRMDIRRNSEAGIANLEKEIQAKLDEAVAKGKVTPSAPNDEYAAMQEKLQEPTVLPNGKPIQRFHPMGDNPNKFTGEFNSQKKGVFQPEDPAVEAKQIEYLKEKRAGDVLKAREAFKARLDDPEYGYGIAKNYAIGRDQIASAFDDVAENVGKIGTESRALRELQRQKTEFLQSHPKWADVQYWNDIKRAIYKQLGDDNFIKQNPSAKVQALKSIANGIKRNIEAKAPGIRELNAEQGALLNIRDAIIDSSPREVRDISLTGPLKERAGIIGSRFLSMPRTSSGGRAAAGKLLMPLANYKDVQEQ